MVLPLAFASSETSFYRAAVKAVRFLRNKDMSHTIAFSSAVGEMGEAEGLKSR